MVMLDTHMPMLDIATHLTILEKDLLMLNQLLNQRLILTMLPTMDMDIHMPITHTQLTILERDLLMPNRKPNQRLILSTMELMDTDILMPITHTQLTMLPTTDMDIHMLVATMVIHMELTMLESKSKT